MRVRYEALAASGATGAGGLCKVKGEWWLLIDKKTTPAERVSMLADALATFDTEGLELPAKAREVIASRRSLKPPGIRRRLTRPAPWSDLCDRVGGGGLSPP